MTEVQPATGTEAAEWLLRSAVEWLAWCLAREVDEEIEFTVGCTDDAASALVEAMPGAVRRVAYGDAAPLYRDPA